MKKVFRNRFVLSGICFAAFLLLILLLKTVDVAPIGEGNTEVGFSALNGSLRKAIGVHLALYKITDVLGILAILCAGGFACLGLYQWIRRKSLKQVDAEILLLGGLFLAAILVYGFFEAVTVNFRPIIMEGSTQPEASFPSSHTVLSCVIFGAIPMLVGKYVTNRKVCLAVYLGCGILLAVTVLGRLFSGVHWFTDILGGVLISTALLFLFAGLLQKVKK